MIPGTRNVAVGPERTVQRAVNRSRAKQLATTLIQRGVAFSARPLEDEPRASVEWEFEIVEENEPGGLAGRWAG